MADVYIVVKGGMVTDTFSTEEGIYTTIIDLDTQDPEREEELDERMAEIQEMLAHGELFYA